MADPHQWLVTHQLKELVSVVVQHVNSSGRVTLPLCVKELLRIGETDKNALRIFD